MKAWGPLMTLAVLSCAANFSNWAMPRSRVLRKEISSSRITDETLAV